MNYAICILLFSLVRISQINFHKLGEIAKNTKFFRHTVNQSMSHLLCVCGPLGAGLEPTCSHAQFTVAVVVVETVRLVLLQEGPQLIVVEIDVEVFRYLETLLSIVQRQGYKEWLDLGKKHQLMMIN